MFIRQPESYYTKVTLDSWLDTCPIHQAPEYIQGSDILLNFSLGECFSLEKHDVTCEIKTCEEAKLPSWTLEKNSITPAAEKSGYYTLFIPASISTRLIPGTYYLVFTAKEKAGVGYQKTMKFPAISISITPGHYNQKPTDYTGLSPISNLPDSTDFSV